MADIIDGKKIAAEIADELAERVKALGERGVVPGLAVVLVGDDPASATYVRLKQRAAERLGVSSTLHKLGADTPAEQLRATIDAVNNDPAVHGILLQLPLPSHLDSDEFLLQIDPAKDIDGLHPANQGLLMQGRPRFVSATPAGVQELLVRSGVEVEGQHVVVVGRSVLVGRPLSVLLSNKAKSANATVTLCHTGTRDFGRYTRQADILVVAAGRAGMIRDEHVSPGCVVIDVGTNPTDEGKLVGDVDFESVSKVARAITPVPGGVGPMTVVMVIANAVQAAELAATS